MIVYNGEVYNHYELRRDLEARGETFRTTSDTEVVLRLLEREGTGALDRLNGQFALAWWQPGPRRLTLVRDRFGVRPLHYALKDDGTLIFGSEAKAIFASGEVKPEPDLRGVDDVFTLWGPRPPRTVFRGVSQVPQGGLLVWEAGRIVEERTWWNPSFDANGGPEGDLEELMRDSVRLRLRADVPVGAYLSGGLDSSLIVALAQQETDHQLRTFSVAFQDPHYDERSHQEEVARALGTDPKLLLLDEPTAGMNPQESARLTEFMQQLRDERVRVGPELLRISYIAFPLRTRSEALCPPKPIEFDIETSNFFLRATFGT